METNLLGTINVLESLRSSKKITQAVCTSSSEIYGLTIGKSIDESHQLFPSSPYAASKLAADRYCYSYINTYNLPLSVIRPFNTFGPRHTYDVIPKFINLALKNKPLTIYGDGKQARDFTYVDDMIEAFVRLMDSPDSVTGPVNLGNPAESTMLELAELILRLTGSQSRLVYRSLPEDDPAQRLPDITLAQETLGWSPTVSLEDGLDRTIHYFQKIL